MSKADLTYRCSGVLRRSRRSPVTQKPQSTLRETREQESYVSNARVTNNPPRNTNSGISSLTKTLYARREGKTPSGHSREENICQALCNRSNCLSSIREHILNGYAKAFK